MARARRSGFLLLSDFFPTPGSPRSRTGQGQNIFRRHNPVQTPSPVTSISPGTPISLNFLGSSCATHTHPSARIFSCVHHSQRAESEFAVPIQCVTLVCFGKCTQSLKIGRNKKPAHTRCAMSRACSFGSGNPFFWTYASKPLLDVCKVLSITPVIVPRLLFCARSSCVHHPHVSMRTSTTKSARVTPPSRFNAFHALVLSISPVMM